MFNSHPMIVNSPAKPAFPASMSACDEEAHTADAVGARDAPAVSVCMPVYNCQRHVAEAVESILSQTFRDFEFLILDDGSTDGTLQILKRYAARDSRIRLISRHNKGLAPTLQELVDQARGEFLARMDGDDIAMPERFQRQVDYLRAHPECVVLGCRVWEADADGDPVGEYFTLSDHEEIDAFHFRMKGPALIHPSVTMRRDAVMAVGGYRNVPIAEEVDLFLRLAERGQVARLPEFLLKYRIHSTNYSRTDTAHEWSYRVLCEILTETYQRRNLPVSLPPPSEIPAVVPMNTATAKFNRRMGWHTLALGHTHTARKYARRALAHCPLSLETWRLMYCALRGY